jgi:hypothetical protein
MDSPNSGEAEALVVGPHPEKVAAAQELIAGILTRMGVKAELATEDLADGIHVRVLAQEGAEVLAGPLDRPQRRPWPSIRRCGRWPRSWSARRRPWAARSGWGRCRPRGGGCRRRCRPSPG